MWKKLPLVLMSYAALCLVACDSDDPPIAATDAGVDARVAAGDAGRDAGDVVDAAIDAPVVDAAALDAVVVDDAGGSDSGSDAGPPPLALFAHIGGVLMRVNVADGTLSELGPTGQPYIAVTWDSHANVARAIVDLLTAPRMATLDLCTGALTTGARLTIGGGNVAKAEGLAQDPTTGIFYVTVDADGSAPLVYLTEASGTVDVATGAVTLLGTHDTLQDDGDWLTFVGEELYLLDVEVPSSAGIYTLDKTTGAATLVRTVAPTVLRIAHDPSRGLMFAAMGTTSFANRQIATLDLGTGTTTSLGHVLPMATHPGQSFTGLFLAPEPICP